jgi:hypothetical protein
LPIFYADSAFYTGRVEQQFPSLDLVQETIEKQLDNQISHIDALDTKVAILFGFLSVTLASAAGSKDFFEAVTRFNALKGAIAAILVGFLFSIWAFNVQNYRRDPKPRGLREQYPNQVEQTTRFALADGHVISFEENLRLIAKKVFRLRVSLTMAAIGGFAVAAHLILQW